VAVLFKWGKVLKKRMMVWFSKRWLLVDLSRRLDSQGFSDNKMIKLSFAPQTKKIDCNNKELQ